ncbi:MAG: S8 family serine peptidase [Ahniella sp.]|nr:S8 family serine peptidase [Ahniella sp.]
MTCYPHALRPIFALLLLGIGASAAAAQITVVPAEAQTRANKEPASRGTDKRMDRGVYMVELREPSVLAFSSTVQLAAQAKSLGLRPTAPDESAQARFDVRTPAVSRYRSYLADRQSAVLADISAQLGRTVVPSHRYDLVSNGFAVTLDRHEAHQLEAHPEVRSVRPEVMYQTHTDFSARFIGADAVWTGTVPGSALQTRGEGVVVGIVDTGINAAHPAFADVAADGYNHTNPRGVRYGLCNNAGESRCNDKLIGIHDFINEAGATGAAAGNDLDGHGTHVAATTAGNPANGSVAAQIVNYNVATTGVAPRSNVIMYKACSATSGVGGSCPGSALTAALNQAVSDGVDVLNFSIGGPAFSPWADPRAFLALRAAGGLSAVSAGNSGPMLGSVRSPSNAPWVVSVANALSNKSFQTTLANISGTGVTSPFSLIGQGTSGGVAEAQVVYAGDFGDGSCVGSFPGARSPDES